MTSSYRHRAARESHQRADGNNKEIYRKENGMKSRYRHLEPLERERERATGQKERHSRCIKSRYIQREQYKREALVSE